MKSAESDLTVLLQAWQSGDPTAAEHLVRSVYDQLRAIAGHLMRSERSEHTLQPTALVHEAWIRLQDRRSPWQSRSQFFAIAATAMRHLLVDHARRKMADRRGGDAVRVELGPEPAGAVTAASPEALIDLHTALGDLESLDSRQARIAELRIFAGATIAEIADLVEVSTATVNRDWRLARAWLQVRLGSTTVHD